MNRPGPPASERISAGSNDLMTTILRLALVTATFRRFSPPSALSHPNLWANLPSASLPYPTENTITSLSSPWTLSTFFTNSPTSSPPRFLRTSLDTFLPNAGSEAHSSSSRSVTRSLWYELKVMIPTVSSPPRSSLRTLTVSSASFLLRRSSHTPSVTRTSMGGVPVSPGFGVTRSLPS